MNNLVSLITALFSRRNVDTEAIATIARENAREAMGTYLDAFATECQTLMVAGYQRLANAPATIEFAEAPCEPIRGNRRIKR